MILITLCEIIVIMNPATEIKCITGNPSPFPSLSMLWGALSASLRSCRRDVLSSNPPDMHTIVDKFAGFENHLVNFKGRNIPIASVTTNKQISINLSTNMATQKKDNKQYYENKLSSFPVKFEGSAALMYFSRYYTSVEELEKIKDTNIKLMATVEMQENPSKLDNRLIYAVTIIYDRPSIEGRDPKKPVILDSFKFNKKGTHLKGLYVIDV
jgi:hypothetical protein